MADFKRFSLILMTGVAGATLAACDGASSIASPGEGVIVVPAPTPAPAPTPTPSPTPTPTPTGPAASCPTGTINSGVIANLRDCRLPTNITTNLSLAKLPGVIYSMSGRTNVGVDVGGDGAAVGGTSATLTIDPGVVIYAANQPTFLVVLRGSQINASGTETQPIIFTSRQNVLGEATDASSNQWGGVVLLGRAPISNCDGGATGGAANCQRLVEGPGANAFYGGALASDTSGTMRYVQIRYTGYSIVEGNELQGLTTGGVGSGTTIEYIQIHNSGDDAIESFGGRQNMRYLVLTGNDDDNLDTDFGYKGAIQFVIAVQRAGAGDTIIEADSDDDGQFDATPRQYTRLANFSFVQLATGSGAVKMRGGPDYSLINGVVYNPSTTAGSCLDIDTAQTVQAADATKDEAGPPTIRSTAFSCFRFDNSDSDTFEADAAQNNPNSTGNNYAATVTLTDGFLPTVTGMTAATNITSSANGGSSFFVQTSYVGAVSGASDLWYRGWTCDSSTANFGSGSACTSLPTS
ncbi:hypothetical protein FPZ54_04530 [Sphingomonas suaedae]|uniref:Lipoprotein n=1 Tax=Sphingomonas suaedae TaxID=2599297 RepID=A0A518RD30_9SPHN|nr:hypothetical protein [Sphingomonas suaedae]QDX25363.1 hypothetical protein FPZ54_04530 [Sphingomonas suaedae]